MISRACGNPDLYKISFKLRSPYCILIFARITNWREGILAQGQIVNRLPRNIQRILEIRRNVPVGVPLDLSTLTGMSCIRTCGENCKSDNVSKYRVL